MRSTCGLILLLCLAAAEICHAQTFYYTGPFAGDFFDELNWTANPDGTGGNPVGNPLVSNASAEIQLDLIIDGDTVSAAGIVDIGSDTLSDPLGGSLTMTAGSVLNVTGGGDFDYNQRANPFSMTGSTLNVDADIFLQAASFNFSGGSVSAGDDIQFENEIDSLTIDGTSFLTTSAAPPSQIFFEFGLEGTATSGNTGTSTHSISNASFTTAFSAASSNKFGLRFGLNLTVTDTDITVEAGTDSVENAFTTGGGRLSDRLTLLGASTLLADGMDDGVDLVLGGSSIATLGANGDGILGDGIDDTGGGSIPNPAQILFQSLDAKLMVSAAQSVATDLSRLINSFTGNNYLTNPEEWNIENWDGIAAITDLQIDVIPEPSSILLGSVCFAAVGLLTRRRPWRA